MAIFVTPASALTTVPASAVSAGANGFKAIAQCPSGQHVISGGFNAVAGSSVPVSRALGDDSWLVRAFDPGFTGYAYCSKTLRTSRVHESVDVPGPVNLHVTPTCPSTKNVLAGGWRMSDPGTRSNAPIFSSFPASARKWSVVGLVDSAPATLKAWAYCAVAPEAKVRTGTASISSQEDATATASCQSGEELMGGGYETTPTPDWNNTTGPDTFVNQSYRSGALDWTVAARNYSSVGGTLTAYAVCG
jgi:hypothetical protein